MISLKKSKFKRILKIIIIIFLIFSIISFVATKVIYDSLFPRFDGAVDIPVALSDFISTREDLSFLSGENKLQGFLYKPEKPNDENALIVLIHGANSYSDAYIWQIKELSELGWAVFAFDATGCNRSEGDGAVGFGQKHDDLNSALNYIEKNDRFGYNNIVLLGHSLGGYAACCALSSRQDISAVVSVSGINSAMEGTIGAAKQYVGPLAYGNYGFLWAYQALLFGAEKTNLKASEAISESNVPVLIINGDKDETAPLDETSIISHRDEIKGDNAEYIIRTSPDASGHTNLLFDPDGTANNEIIEQINSFLIKSIN